MIVKIDNAGALTDAVHHHPIHLAVRHGKLHGAGQAIGAAVIVFRNQAQAFVTQLAAIIDKNPEQSIEIAAIRADAQGPAGRGLIAEPIGCAAGKSANHGFPRISAGGGAKDLSAGIALHRPQRLQSGLRRGFLAQ